MAENDIYDSQGKYERLVRNLNKMAEKPTPTRKNPRERYYCKNPANLEYFRRFFKVFEAKDTSYVRRLRLLNYLKLIVFATEKNLKDLTREDIDELVAFMHHTYKSSKTKTDFIRETRYIWRTLFPEVDGKGRIDETVTPYVVRHLSAKMDKSREKRKEDRLSPEEFERIVAYFSANPCMQLYLTLSLESLGRPQEVLYTKIKDVELHDNYAKIWISEHGKEGTGILQCINSFPYLQEWLKRHPLQKDRDSFLFINSHRKEQLTPYYVNKMLRDACKRLDINKPITCYSIKRNGVTFRRIRGDSDVEIQHAARWVSTKQLKIYDKTDQEDAFRISLIKNGLLKDDRLKEYEPKVKTCVFCNTANGFTAEICSTCKRPLDRTKMQEEFKQKELDFEAMKAELAQLQARVNQDAMQKVFSILAHFEEEITKLKSRT